MEPRNDIELTPEQKGVLASMAEKTGKPITALIQQMLDALQAEGEVQPDTGVPRPNGEADTSMETQERRALKKLEEQGILHLNERGKPKGVRGVTVRGKPMSETVLDARR